MTVERPDLVALDGGESGRPKTRRGTSNRDARGNTRDRARRRAFLLAKHGDGTTCPCYRCGVTLDDSTITVDRIVPGCDGGRYTRDNIRPACGPCNSETGGALATRHRSRLLDLSRPA